MLSKILLAAASKFSFVHKRQCVIFYNAIFSIVAKVIILHPMRLIKSPEEYFCCFIFTLSNKHFKKLLQFVEDEQETSLIQRECNVLFPSVAIPVNWQIK